MSYSYSRQIATAKRLIAKYGQSVTWKVLREGTLPDAAKPWAAGTLSSTSYTVNMAFFPINRINFEGQHLIKLTSRGDEFSEQSVGHLVGYTARQTFTPSIKDVVVRSNIEHRVFNVKELNVNGQNILWIVEFEK